MTGWVRTALLAAGGLILAEGFPAWPGKLALFNARDDMHWIGGGGLAGGEALSASRGKWTVVNLWATWCGPCVMELPDFDKLSAALDGKVGVFAINADNQGKDTPEAVATLFKSKGMTRLKPLVAGDDVIDGVVSGAGLSRDRLGYPMTVIFAPDGRPFAYVQDSAADWQAGASGWATPEMIAFFDKLAAMPAPA